MAPSSHTALADLLVRACKGLANSDRPDPEQHQHLLAELAAAQQVLTVSSVPWTMSLCIGIVDHRHGLNVYVAHSRAALDQELATYCHDWRSETGDPRHPASLDESTLIEAYFEGHDRESLTVEMVTLDPLPMRPATTAQTGPEHGRYCVLSTVHLTSVTGDLLDLWASWPPGERPLDIAAAVHGWFVPTRPLAPERAAQLPEDLSDLMTFGRARDFDYVLVDCDGDEVNGLKVHGW